MEWLIVIIVLIFTFIIELILFKGFYKALSEQIENLSNEEPLIQNKTFDICYSLDTTNSIIIPVKIKEKEYKFLIDTGSTNCILNETHFTEDFMFEHKTENCDIIGIEGNTTTCEGYLIDTEVLGKIFQIPYNKMKFPDNIEFDGILGSNFLVISQYIIDFNKKIIIHDKNSNRKS